jgi:hypothetical protein
VLIAGTVVEQGGVLECTLDVGHRHANRSRSIWHRCLDGEFKRIQRDTGIAATE